VTTSPAPSRPWLDTPIADAYLASLDDVSAGLFAQLDAAELVIDKDRLAPRIAQKITESPRSVRRRLGDWERLSRRLHMRPDGLRPEEYVNYLDIRDALERILDSLEPWTRSRFAVVLGAIDDQFKSGSAEDGGASYANYLRQSPHEAARREWWWNRRPLTVPWDV
jgi:hypothetical protein